MLWDAVVIDESHNLINEPGARLALAGAHGCRIAGAAGETRRLFRQVWNRHSGPVRLRARFCMADLDM